MLRSTGSLSNTDSLLLQLMQERHQEMHTVNLTKTGPRMDNHTHYVHKKKKQQFTGDEVILEILKNYEFYNLFPYIRQVYLGMNLLYKSKGNNRTMLHTTAAFSNELSSPSSLLEAINFSKILLKAGIGVNDQDAQGNTALHLVINNSDHAYLCFLLKNGADPFIQNQEGQSPLDRAKLYCSGREEETAGGLLLKCHNNLFFVKPILDRLTEIQRFSITTAHTLGCLASLVYKRKKQESTSDVYLVPESLYTTTTTFIRRRHYNNIIAHTIAKWWGFHSVVVIDDFSRCLICRYNNVWILSFKGTDKVDDILADLNVLTIEEDKYVSGIYKLLVRIWPQIVSVLPAYSKDSDTLIYCTGHSMGGALSTMAADFLLTKENYPPKSVILYSFASPRCGTGELRNSISNLMHAYSIVRCGDPIPHLPTGPSALFAAVTTGSVRYLDENGKLFNDNHYKFHDIAREMNRQVTNMLDHCNMWIEGFLKFRSDEDASYTPDHKRALIGKIIDTLKNPTEFVNTLKKPHAMEGYLSDLYNLQCLISKPIVDRSTDLITSPNLQKIEIPDGFLDRYIMGERLYLEKIEAFDNWAKNYAKTSKVEPFTFTEDTEQSTIVNWFESEIDILKQLESLESEIRAHPKFDQSKIPTFTLSLLPIQEIKISPYIQCKLLRILQIIYFSIQSHSMAKHFYRTVTSDFPAGWLIEPKLVVENDILVPELVNTSSGALQQIIITEKSVNYSKIVFILQEHLLNQVENQINEQSNKPAKGNEKSQKLRKMQQSMNLHSLLDMKTSHDSEYYRKKFQYKLRHFRKTTGLGYRYETSEARNQIKNLIFKPENYKQKTNEIRDREKLKQMEEYVVIFHCQKLYEVHVPEILEFFAKFKKIAVLKSLQNYEFSLKIQDRPFTIILNYPSAVSESALNYLSFKLVKKTNLFKFQGFFKKEKYIFPFLVISEEENTISLENFLTTSYLESEQSIVQYSRIFLLNLVLILSGEISDFTLLEQKEKKKLINKKEIVSEMNQKYPLNILFCMNEVFLPVHKSLMADFKELNLKLIIEKWVKHLRESDSLVRFYSDDLSYHLDLLSESNFNERWLVNFTNRIYNVQKFWESAENPSHLDTLLHIFPEHKELFAAIFFDMKTPIERYNFLKHKFEREFNLNVLMPNLNLGTANALRLGGANATGSLLGGVNFDLLSPARTSSDEGAIPITSNSKTIVNYIFDGGSLETIENCKSMLANYVKQSSTLSSTELIHVQKKFFEHFLSLKSTSLELFLETFQTQLASLVDPEERRSLQSLLLDALCARKFELVNINLNYFEYLDNCALDKILRLNSKTIKSISLRECSRLTHIGISGWFKKGRFTDLPNLEKMDISGCCNIEDCSKFFINPNPSACFIANSRFKIKKNTPERIFTQILPCLARGSATIVVDDSLDKSTQQLYNDFLQKRMKE